MVARNRFGTALAAALLATLTISPAVAGPADISTNYPVELEVGGKKVSGIVDSGGLTTLSFEDAKAAGLLDDNGDPVNPADGSVTLGGTGGGTVKCHRFNDVTVKVQPKNADGTNNGPAREIKVTVVVPKKPAEQEGANDAEKTKKTNSVSTKAGRNIVGATIDGHKLDLTDKETEDAKKNERSTGWQAVGTAAGGAAVPVEEDKNETDNSETPSRIMGADFNGMPLSPFYSGAPMSIIPEWMAIQLGAIPLGPAQIGMQAQQTLFSEGLWPYLPQESMQLPSYAINVVLHSTNAGPVLNDAPVVFLAAPFIQQPVLGSNALVPQNMIAELDSDLGVIWYRDYCPADFDGSGFVDTDDFDAFVNEFILGSPAADFDGSGFTDTDDYDAFIHAFEAGC
ncbi:MAG: hypothetical protein GIKADHBN_01637 [Phycisphaerales bacterium]|nr:hypothetical protein [Phycisphaerales bacterium]